MLNSNTKFHQSGMKIKLQLRQIVKMMFAVPLLLMMWSNGTAQHQVLWWL